MFKLKKGNVFQKLNNMDRKKAYTLGAVIVVCFFALIILASFMGSAEDESFDGFNSRGYDLAQMPFVNDEAEQFLLAAKYPDMQDNGSTLLYSAEEKEERQEADAEEEEEEGEGEEEETSSDEGTNDSSYSGGSYSGGSSGYRGRGGSSGPTQVNRLGNASTAHASGGGITGTWGAPRGDFSPYKSQDKGREIAPQTLQNQNARKALTQFARGSQAAAGLRDGKGGNAKKALMGGTIQGSEAFTDKGIDLSKAGGLALDTNAPTSSGDLSGLADKVNDGAQNAKDKDDNDKETLKDQLLKEFYSGLINLGMQLAGSLANWGIAEAQSAASASADTNAHIEGQVMDLINTDPKDWSESQKALAKGYGYDPKKGGDFKTQMALSHGVEGKPIKTSSSLPSTEEDGTEIAVGKGGGPGLLSKISRQGYETYDMEYDAADVARAVRQNTKDNTIVAYTEDMQSITKKQYFRASKASANTGATHIDLSSLNTRNTGGKTNYSPCSTGQRRITETDSSGNVVATYCK